MKIVRTASPDQKDARIDRPIRLLRDTGQDPVALGAETGDDELALAARVAERRVRLRLVDHEGGMGDDLSEAEERRVPDRRAPEFRPAQSTGGRRLRGQSDLWIREVEHAGFRDAAAVDPGHRILPDPHHRVDRAEIGARSAARTCVRCGPHGEEAREREGEPKLQAETAPGRELVDAVAEAVRDVLTALPEHRQNGDEHGRPRVDPRLHARVGRAQWRRGPVPREMGDRIDACRRHVGISCQIIVTVDDPARDP